MAECASFATKKEKSVENGRGRVKQGERRRKKVANVIGGGIDGGTRCFWKTIRSLVEIEGT